MRIFLDANILFSASKAAGAVKRLLDDAREAGHVLVADAYVAGEARRNSGLKFPERRPDLETLLGEVETAAIISAIDWPDPPPALPSKDLPVLAAAVPARCDRLVTGDRTHFGGLFGVTLSGVRILSPAMLAAELFPNETDDARA